MLNSWTRLALSRLYPPRCLLCGAPGISDRDICQGCYHDLPWNVLPCPCCGLPLPPSSERNSLCGQCQQKPPPFDQSNIPFLYTGHLPHLITGFKFRNKLNHGRLLSQMLVEHLEQTVTEWPDLILPVPLHPQRQRQRGYNQALEIARPLSRQFKLPMEPQLLCRIRATAPQADLDKKKRRQNIRNAFEVVEKPRVNSVALVDDVVTTGQTVAEVARLLKRAGVRQVSIWAIARTP